MRPRTDLIDDAEQQRLVALRMFEAFSDKRYDRALAIAEHLIARNDEHEAALRIAEAARNELDAEAATFLDSFDGCPISVATELEIEELDVRSVRLLALMDGTRTTEDVLALADLGEKDGIRRFSHLMAMGLVKINE